MERMLFEEDGVKRCLRFAKLIGWDKRKWKGWRGNGVEERMGRRMRPRVEGGGGWLMERSEKRRREIRKTSAKKVCSGHINRASGQSASTPCAPYVLIVYGVCPLHPVHSDRLSILFSIFLCPVPPNAPISILSTQRTSPGLISSQFHLIPLPFPLLPRRTPVYSYQIPSTC